MRGEPLPDRARCRRGRVMHRVNRVPHYGSEPDLESQCRKGSGIKGVKTTHPSAEGPESEWSFERLDYPDCMHCPAESEGQR